MERDTSSALLIFSGLSFKILLLQFTLHRIDRCAATDSHRMAKVRAWRDPLSKERVQKSGLIFPGIVFFSSMISIHASSPSLV